MGWSIGWDSNWQRDIGYGVPAYCDHPECNEEIDRGLSFVCGGEPYGGEHGCGLYFCEKHRANWIEDGDHIYPVCDRCASQPWLRENDDGVLVIHDIIVHGNYEIPEPFEPKPEHPTWLRWKLRDASWHQWRQENPAAVAMIREQLAALAGWAV
ncbi:MAG: hypothetical protein AAFX44_06765 [Pseudomonadota bacterium]